MAGKPNKAEVEQAKLDTARALFGKHNSELKAVQKEPPLLTRVSEYQDFFVRDPDLFVTKIKTTDRTKKTLELVRYLFQKYPVPSFMNYIWQTGAPRQVNKQNEPYRATYDTKYSEYEMWYICVATGGSLHKEYFKDFFTKKESHVFLNCRFDLTIPQALVFAVGKANGAKDGNALRVARSKIASYKLNDFWKYSIQFFAKEDTLTVNQIDDLIDYLRFKRYEGGKDERTSTFTISGKGHTIASLTQKMNDWHYDMRRMKAIGDEHWEGNVQIPDQTYNRRDINGKTTKWYFKQIKSAKELQREGNQQRHCVFGYKDRCVKGAVSIWSLSMDDEYGGNHRKLTIELTSDNRIVQARGISNRTSRPEEAHLLSVWARDHHLSISIYGW